jgi:hypothetical protein
MIIVVALTFFLWFFCWVGYGLRGYDRIVNKFGPPPSHAELFRVLTVMCGPLAIAISWIPKGK